MSVPLIGPESDQWITTSHPTHTSTDDSRSSILRRLLVIESRLGIVTNDPSATCVPPSTTDLCEIPAERSTEHHHRQPSLVQEVTSEYGALGSTNPLPDLLAVLQYLAKTSGVVTHDAWQPIVVETLWMAFAENMPALHFSTQRVFINSPTPLLLSAVLYAASMQHTLSRFTQLSPIYRRAAARCIADLAIPTEMSEPDIRSDDKDMHDTLGIIITGLMSEAWIPVTGTWIAIAYQLILSRSARSRGARLAEWRGLYEGLRVSQYLSASTLVLDENCQVVDLEHASLRMTCPLLPLQTPLACLLRESTYPTSSAPTGAYTDLTTIMHVGLSYFSGRHLPTVMQTVLGSTASIEIGSEGVNFSAEDLRVIKGWAKELDNWLLKFHKPTNPRQRGPTEANIILLQYQLHKLFVLSIYHPARGVDVSSHTPSSPERNELLVSARGALRLQRMGMSVWSNWDLVIITSASLVVLDGLRDGLGERDGESTHVNRYVYLSLDIHLVQGHINALRSTHQPTPNLRDTLASRLDLRLRSLDTPSGTVDALPSADPSFEYMSIFNSNSEAFARVDQALNQQTPAFDQNAILHDSSFPASNLTLDEPPRRSQRELEGRYPSRSTDPTMTKNGIDTLVSDINTYSPAGFPPQGQTQVEALDWWSAFGMEAHSESEGIITWPPAFQRVMGNLADVGVQGEGGLFMPS
ncbi:hypothetical protein P7C73_g974, partial [Tremellales sp. Uapishka_1]